MKMARDFSFQRSRKSLICYFVLLLLAIEISAGPDLCDINMTVKLKRELKYKGFHRDISTEYSFAPVEDLVNFYVLAIEHLPADVYIILHDLNHLAKLGGTQVLVFDNVQVEAPADASSPIDVHMFLNSQDTLMKTILPVHMRYQKAHYCTDKGHFVKIRFKLPTIFVRFEGIDLIKCEKAITAPCGVNREDCSWIPVNVISNISELSLAVPVGCSEDDTLVTGITFLAIVAGLVVLIRVLFNYEDDDEKTE